MTVRTILLRLVFGVVLLFLLIAVFHAIETWRGERAWQDYVTAARGRSAKLYATEFQGPPIAPEQNYAAIPVFEEAFAAADAGTLGPQPLAFPDKGFIKPKVEAAKGDRIDLKAWRDYFLKTGLLTVTSEDAAADVLRALETYEPTIQQLRDAGKRPAARFPVKWERGFDAPAPHYGVISAANWIFSLRISAHLAQGNNTAAYSEFQHGFRLCRALDKEPTLFSGLLRLNTISNLLQPVWEGLAERRWTDAELRGISAELSTLRLVDDLRFSWDSERTAMNVQLDLFARMSSREMLRRFSASSGGAVSMVPSATALQFTLGYPRGWFRQNQVLMNDIYDVALKRFDMIEHGGVASAPKDDRVQSLSKASALKRWYYAWTNVIMSPLDGAENRFFAAEARVQQAITACALERYFNAHGSYPAKLEDLVPEYLDEVPRDILANAPMRYRQTQEGRYELWAVGQNAQDDGAKIDPKKSFRQQPDWVWHFRKADEGSPKTSRP